MDKFGPIRKSHNQIIPYASVIFVAVLLLFGFLFFQMAIFNSLASSFGFSGEDSARFSVPFFGSILLVGIALLAVFAYLIAKYLGIGDYYALDDSGLIISRTFFKTRYSFDKIKSFEIISSDDFKNTRSKGVLSEFDLRESEKEDVFKYFFVPVSSIQIIAGSFRKESLDVPRGNYVLMETVSGSEFLLSPNDSAVFLQAVSRRRSGLVKKI